MGMENTGKRKIVHGVAIEIIQWASSIMTSTGPNLLLREVNKEWEEFLRSQDMTMAYK